MAVHVASTPLPPNVHVVYEVLCSEGPRTGGELELLLEKRGVVVPADRLLELPRRFPGVFTMDRHERLAVPPACQRCGAHACDGCRREVDTRPCLVCERTVCRSCRATQPDLESCCVDCAAPTRVPEADQRYGRAWALGGDRWLLVGERSAMPVGAPGGPRVLVPDSDLADPVRGRLRALAAALHFPPEIGLRLRGPAPPPPVGALQITPVLEVTHVEVTADGLERRRERHAPGGPVETSVERVPFEPDEHPTDSPARPVATATLGPVTARLDAVHASYQLVATAPGATTCWFAPGAPGVTLASEVTWGSVVPLAKLAPGTRIHAPRETRPTTPEDFA